MKNLTRVLIDDVINWEISEPEKKGGSFVAFCEKLGLSVEAKSHDDLKSMVRDAVDVLMEDLREHDDTISYLISHDIRFRVEPIVKETRARFSVLGPAMMLESRRVAHR